MSRFSYKTLFIILIFLLIPVVFLLKINQKSTKTLAAWWNDSWMYRQAINISSHSSAESNVYITTTINIGDTTKTQSDAGDFRFTDAGGNLLSYYLVSGTGTTAITFHIQLDSFPSGAQTIYAYYGNPSASNGFSASDFSTAATNYTIGSLGTEETGGAPVAWWKFDEGAGTTAHDSSTHNISATFTGTTIPTWNDHSSCINGTCLNFSPNAAITTSDNSALHFNTNSFTISGWALHRNYNYPRSGFMVKKSGTCYNSGSGNAGFDIGHGYKSNGIDICLHDNNDVMVHTTLVFDTGYQPSQLINKWTHYSIVFDRDLDKVFAYVNGTKQSQEIDISTIIGSIDNNYGLRIGEMYGWLSDAKYDNLRIYSYARTAAQVLQEYNTDISGQSSSDNTNTSFGSSSAKSLSDGLVGYWKFDEGVGTSSADSSGNNKTATFGVGDSSPTWFSAKYGIGLSFNGTSNYVNVSNFNIPYDQTISLWLKPTETSNNEWIISLGPSWHYELSIRSNKLAFTTHDSTGNYLYCTGNTNLSANNFYHITTTYNNTTKEKYIYINGVLDKKCTQQESNVAGQTNKTISIGGGSFIAGLIDEIRVYNRALSADEVKQLYNYAPDPIGYWKFDEGIGTTVYDSSGNNNNLRWFGGNNYYQQGKIDKSGYFNSDRRAELTDTSRLNLSYQSFTLSSWMKWGVNNIVIPFAKGTNGYSTPGFYVYQNSNTIYFYVGDGTNYIQPYINFSSYRYSWNYYTFTYDSTLKKGTIYINGVPLASSANINIASIGNTLPFMFGASSTGYNWQGNLDEVKVYNYTRTQEQILQDMQDDSTSSKLAGPIVWYKLDNSIGNTIPNSGSLGNQAKGTSTINTPQFSSGKIDKSLNFTGSNYVNIGISIPTQAYTKSLWLKYAPGGLNYNIMSGSNGNVLYAANGIGNKLASGHNGAWTTVQDSVALDTNWHHVVVTYDSQSNGSLKLYKDTVLISSAVGVSPPSGDTGFYLGAWNGGNTWVGQLDDVKIYNYALSADEIKADYNQSSSVVFGVTNLTVGNTSTSATYCVPGSTDPCSPPIGEWKFEEGVGTTAYDTSGNNNKLAINNATFTPGKIGKSLSFNGTNSYTNYTDPGTSSLDITGTGTFEAWVKWNTFKDYGVILQKGNGGSPTSFNYGIWSYSNRIQCYIGDGSTINQTSVLSSNIPVGVWHHIACVADGTNFIPYVDGVRYPSTSQTIALTANNNPFSISHQNYSLDGSIDQVRIYNYARTPAQIAWDYNQGAPIGWWKFDECQGSVVNDSSGIGNTGSITIGTNGSQNTLGTCQIGTSAAWTNGASGKFNSSLSFDGTDDYIGITNSATLFNTQSDFTISAWAKPNNTLTDQDVIAATNGYFVGLSSISNKMCLQHWSTSNSNFSACEITAADTNWHHYIGTFSGNTTSGTLTLYKDGIYQNSTNITNPSSKNAFHIGGKPTNSYYAFPGLIDDVRIYNYALTPEQIKQVYNGGAINFN